ncbi:MAG TPA: tetratricopeptide repeat protein [Thermoanaerobaculia bacterium]|jgi:tetratricopeptide (TPR) repeat protein
MTGYATREVAQALGLSPAQVRSYVRAGFLSPDRSARGHFRFSFPDLVFLRAAKSLLDARIPARRVRRALARIVRQLPESGRITELRIQADGERIVVGDGRARWRPESGQRLLDFDTAVLAAPVEPLPGGEAPPAGSGEPLSAERWYEIAVDLEEREPAGAVEAYERALRLDAEHADAHVNLGRLLHERGDAAAAEEHYRLALAARPSDATAAFNLGVALQDLARDRDALVAYERAIALDPEDADARFNAAAVSERLGDSAAALRHWTGYRRLTSGR